MLAAQRISELQLGFERSLLQPRFMYNLFFALARTDRSPLLTIGNLASQISNVRIRAYGLICSTSCCLLTTSPGLMGRKF
jgi:hypothetical protein